MSLDVDLTYPNKRRVALEAALAAAAAAGHDCAAAREALDYVLSDHTTSVLDEEVAYEANITHNLNKMAEAAGIYMYLWRPEEIGITKAAQLIDPLRLGHILLVSDPPRFEAYNAPNGWGLYEHFVPWVERYLRACEQHPDADVRVSR